MLAPTLRSLVADWRPVLDGIGFSSAPGAVVFTGGNYNSDLASRPFEMLADYIVPAFHAPEPLDTVVLSQEEMERLVGTYYLDFDSSGTSVVSIDGDRLRLFSPDNEFIYLTAHSPTFFTCESQYGLLTVVFEPDNNGRFVRHTVYGRFQRFVFERQ